MKLLEFYLNELKVFQELLQATKSNKFLVGIFERHKFELFLLKILTNKLEDSNETIF